MKEHIPQFYLTIELADAAEASNTKETGTRACRQAAISKGRNPDPSKRRFTPGRTTSLLSASSDSTLEVLKISDSSSGLIAAS